MRYHLRAIIPISSLCIFTLVGSVFVRLKEKEIISGSKAIVEGTVTGFRPHWNERKTFVYTEFDIEVKESLIGAVDSTIKVTVPGGTMGGDLFQVHGTPLLRTNKRYLLFLTDDKTKAMGYRIFGYAQGLYIIKTREGEDIAYPMADGVLFLDNNGNKIPGLTPRPLQVLKNRIKQVEAELGLR